MTWIWEEATYRTVNGKPEILLFSRKYEDKYTTTTHIVRGFEPYFYVPAHERHYDYLIVRYGPDIEIDALGREVRKCYTRIPGDVPKIRSKFEWTDMADFLFEKRFLVDTGLKYAYDWDEENENPIPVDVPAILMPRVVYYDIEVLSPASVMPLPHNPNYPVVSIQVMDSYTKKILVFTNGLPCNIAPDHIECGSERKLFQAFQSYLKEINPDVVTGWNCLPSNTLVFTKDGLRRIDSIKEGDLLPHDNEVKRVENTGIKEIYSINTMLGWNILSSAEHKFLIKSMPDNRNYYWKHISNYNEYWKEAKDLCSMDMLLCPFGRGVDNNNNGFDLNDLYLMGFIYGDGTFSDKNTYALYNKDKSLIERLKVPERAMWFSKGVWCTKIARKHYKHVEQFITNDKGKKGINIEKLSLLSLREFCAFLAGWYDADGSFWTYSKFMFSDVSRKNQDMCKLFIHFGFVASYTKRDGYNIIQGFHESWDYIKDLSHYKDSIQYRDVRLRSPERKEYFKFSFTQDFRYLCVGITNVESTNKFEECYDMETTSHYYNIGCIVHNCTAYDVPYLVKRAQLQAFSIKDLGRYGVPYAEFETDKNSWGIRVKGRSTLDMLEAFKKLMIMKSQRESYALKEVSKDYGFEYIDYGPKLQRLFDDQDWHTFVQYCRNDVISLELIDNHPDVILFEFYEYLRMICGTRLDDVLYNSKLIEMYLLHDGIKPMPTKKHSNVEKDKFEGAFVMSPPPGVHYDVGTVDLAALYPTIMRAFPDETSPDIDHKIIEMLNTFVDEREKLRELRKSGDNSSGTAVREYAYKVLANSVYGVVGSPAFRLFKRECAEFVTFTGRTIIHYIQDRLEKVYGKEVIYGDSVTGDTRVKIFDSNNNAKVVNIDTLFTQLDYNSRKKEYCNIDNLFIETYNDDMDIVLDRIMYIMRHKIDKQLYKVDFSNGSSIVATEDHSIYCWDTINCKLITVETKHILGKYVPYINRIHNCSHVTRVVGLTKLDKDYGYVYDLSTEKYHRYFANDILVHNTDSSAFKSVFSHVEGLEIQDKLNEDLIAWGEERGAKVKFSLKFEKLYRTLMFKKGSGGKKVAKKKYCGHLLWEEGQVKDELNFKGIELKRSDQSKLSKTCLFTFLEMVLMKNQTEEAVKYVREVYRQSLQGDVDYRDASIPKMIRTVKNNSPHARGIQNTKNHYHYNIPDGVKPRLLYLKGEINEICIDDDLELDQVTIDNIDWVKMTDSIITKKMKSYIESLGYKWDTVIHGQTGLDKWR